jgi:hypothetical protein
VFPSSEIFSSHVFFCLLAHALFSNPETPFFSFVLNLLIPFRLQGLLALLVHVASDFETFLTTTISHHREPGHNREIFLFVTTGELQQVVPDADIDFKRFDQ